MQTTPAASSHDEQPTPAHDDSSDAQEQKPPTSSTNSWTRALQNVDPTKLSPTSQATKILIGDRISDGYKLSELAKELGRPASWVSERLDALRNALLLQSGLFFPLSDGEYEALTESIRRHGVQTPIVIGEHVPLIDGRHRCLISEELGLEDIPAVFLTDLTAEQERELAIGLNAARRQLTRRQKRALIEDELMRDPARSNSLIASICGVTHPTVASVRNEIAEQQRAETLSAPTNEEPKPEDPPNESDDDERVTVPPQTATAVLERPRVEPATRVDASGRHQPAPPPTQPARVQNLGYVTCTHGQVHSLHKDPDGTYRIQEDRD